MEPDRSGPGWGGRGDGTAVKRLLDVHTHGVTRPAELPVLFALCLLLQRLHVGVLYLRAEKVMTHHSGTRLPHYNSSAFPPETPLFCSGKKKKLFLKKKRHFTPK